MVLLLLVVVVAVFFVRGQPTTSAHPVQLAPGGLQRGAAGTPPSFYAHPLQSPLVAGKFTPASSNEGLQP